MTTSKKSSVTKKPKVVGIEVLKKNGVDVNALVKQLITNASVEFTAYYYFTNLRMHATGMLQKVPMTEVLMTPNTTNTVGLDELNKIIADQRGVTIADLAMKDPNELPEGTTVEEVGSVNEIPQKANTQVVAESQAAETLQAPSDGVLSDADLAASYRSQADRLYKEAKALRAQAEELVPTTKKSKSAKETA